MIGRILGGCGLALILGLYAERVSAGQIFLCEDGKSVEIATADLEEAKRFDPCVARYFGRSVDVAAMPFPVRKPARAGLHPDIAAVAKALRSRQQRSAKAAPAAKSKKPVAELQDKPIIKAVSAKKPVAAVTPMKSTQQPKRSALERGLAALGAGSYRNVRIINRDEASGWYRHER